MAEPPWGHEPSGIAVGRILGTGAILAIGVIVTVVAVCLVLQHRLEPARARLNARTAVIPPAPRLQSHPAADLAAFRTQKQALLAGWGWTDETHRFAHLPIEQAMAMYVRQHTSPPHESSGGATGIAARRVTEHGR